MTKLLNSKGQILTNSLSQDADYILDSKDAAMVFGGKHESYIPKNHDKYANRNIAFVRHIIANPESDHAFAIEHLNPYIYIYTCLNDNKKEINRLEKKGYNKEEYYIEKIIESEPIAKLKRSDKFIDLVNCKSSSGIDAYGGDQNWLISMFESGRNKNVLDILQKADSACSMVGLINAFVYSAQYDENSVFKKLPAITKNEFIALVDDLYTDFLNKYSKDGNPSGTTVNSRIKFLKNKSKKYSNLNIESNIFRIHRIHNNYNPLNPLINKLINLKMSYTNAVDFLKKQLSNEHPVCLSMQGNPYARTLSVYDIMCNLHMVIITELHQNYDCEWLVSKTTGERKLIKRELIKTKPYMHSLILSNWGLRTHIPNFYALWRPSKDNTYYDDLKKIDDPTFKIIDSRLKMPRFMHTTLVSHVFKFKKNSSSSFSNKDNTNKKLDLFEFVKPSEEPK